MCTSERKDFLTLMKEVDFLKEFQLEKQWGTVLMKNLYYLLFHLRYANRIICTCWIRYFPYTIINILKDLSLLIIHRWLVIPMCSLFQDIIDVNHYYSVKINGPRKCSICICHNNTTSINCYFSTLVIFNG